MINKDKVLFLDADATKLSGGGWLSFLFAKPRKTAKRRRHRKRSKRSRSSKRK